MLFSFNMQPVIEGTKIQYEGNVKILRFIGHVLEEKKKRTHTHIHTQLHDYLKVLCVI